MGEPDYLSREQLCTLEGASAICSESIALETREDGVYADVTLPPMGAALVTIFR